MAGEVRRKRLRALGALVAKRALDPSTLESAFVHESAVKEGLAPRSNERLEFLGDAVLGLAVAACLHERYPQASEGELALRKSNLVSDAALAATAERLELEALLVLGQGLANGPASRRRSIVANAFEALLGAVFLQAGFAAAAAFVGREHIDEREKLGLELEDPKTVLQEWAQRRHGRLPEYVERASGPDHERIFDAHVSVAGERLAAGSGSSKKSAQRAAAAAALDVLRGREDDVSSRPLSVPGAARA